MDSNLKAILLRFPHFSDRIIQRTKENEDFESLCIDYEICMNILTELANETNTKHTKLEEYLEIKKDLEAEVLKYLR